MPLLDELPTEPAKSELEQPISHTLAEIIVIAEINRRIMFRTKSPRGETSDFVQADLKQNVNYLYLLNNFWS